MNTSKTSDDQTGGLASPRPTSPQNDDQGKGPGGIVPDLASRTVVAVFDTADEASAAASALRANGIPEADISVVRRGDDTPPAQSADDTKSDSGTIAGASAGAIIGGALGLAALAIPGIGPLLAAGPILAALGGAVTGGAVGGLVGSFAGLGVPTDDAKNYDAAVRSGAVIVAVKAQDAAVADACVVTLRQHGARNATGYQPAL